MPADDIWVVRKSRLNELYSPAAPINSEKLFYGRKEQLNRVHETVDERGLHLVLYGERGVGKTSLANIVEQRYTNAITAKITCNSDSTLSGMWKSIFKKIPISYDIKRLIGFHTEEDNRSYVESVSRISDLIAESQSIGVDEITAYLDDIKSINIKFLLIFDEFDQIGDRGTLQGFSDIVKYLSDNVPNVTVMIVGIGRSIVDLIGEHQSIERCIRQVHLERMSDDELSEIVTIAAKELGMSIDPAVVQKTILYSSGFAHYTHLLGKYTTKRAIESRSSAIEMLHFTQGMTEALSNVNETIRNTYQSAVLSPKESTLFEDVLYACAMVDTDEHGTFRASDLVNPISRLHGTPRKIQAFQYHLGKLCLEERGAVLERITVAKSRTRYRFCNPLFRAYVRLRYHEKHRK